MPLLIFLKEFHEICTNSQKFYSEILLELNLCFHEIFRPRNLEPYCIIYLDQNIPGVKKVVVKNLKKDHVEKDVKSKWVAKASCC